MPGGGPPYSDAERMREILTSYGVRFVAEDEGASDGRAGGVTISYACDQDNVHRLASVLRKLDARPQHGPDGVGFLIDPDMLRAGRRVTFDTIAGPITIDGSAGEAREVDDAAIDPARPRAEAT